MCYITFELLSKSGQGLFVFNIKNYITNGKVISHQREVNPSQTEGNVDSCLYSRGRSSN